MRYNSPADSRFALTLGGALVTTLAMAGIPSSVAAQDAATLAELERQIQVLSQEVSALKRAPVGAGPIAADAKAANISVDQLGAQTVRTAPSPGIDGHPFYTEKPEGRETGVLATGNDKVRLTFSGQINRALNIIDDGVTTDLYQVDNENASSRFRFLGETSPYHETQAVSLFEFEWPVNGSLDVSQLEQNTGGDLNIRLLDIGFSNNNVGSFFIGQGWMASDGTAEVDLSGTTTASWSGETFAFGGMLPTADGGFVPKSGVDTTAPDFNPDDASNYVNVFGLGHNMDGLSRMVRVRYNSPIFAGFQLSTSAAADGFYDVAVRYGGKTGWARFAAAGSYWTDAKSGGYDAWTASGSIILTDEDRWWGGTSLTLSGAKQDFDDKKNSPTTYFGKLAYVTDLTDWGRTGFSVMYANYDEFREVNESMDIYGLGFSQNVDQIGTELYMGLHRAEFDSKDIAYNDMNFLQFGAMVRF